MAELLGKWIGYITEKSYDCSDKMQAYGSPSPYFRREFVVRKKILRAELKITALGSFRAYLNGENVTADMFTPSWTDYNKRVEYSVYDVTNMLKSGKNALGVVLGDGWYASDISQCGRFNYGQYPLKLWFNLVVEYMDGETETLVSDDKTLASVGEILASDIQNGEKIDKTLSLGDFSGVNYEGVNFRNVQEFDVDFSLFSLVFTPPIRANIVLKPTPINRQGNKILYDNGQNLAGLVRLTLRGERGQKVVVRYGEMLNLDGSLYTSNLRTALVTDSIILSGENDDFLPQFTFHGFRYFEINSDSPYEILFAETLACFSNLEKSGEFFCDNSLVNKIYSNALWGQRSNFYSVPTDCPQRDERLGWTGDAQVFCNSAMYNMNCKDYYAKYLRDIRDSMDEDGCVPNIAPYLPIVGKGFAAWSDALVIITYRHYVMYGDKQVIFDNLTAIKKWLGYLQNNCQDYIRPQFSYGDWLSVGEETDLAVFNTAFFAYSAYLTARICEIVDDSDSKIYYTLFDNIRGAFNRKFVDSDGKILSDTQTAYLLAYQFGLCDKTVMGKHLLRRLKENNDNLSCGFIGIEYLLPTLFDIGAAKIAYDLILKTSYPSWGYSIANGATTMWERWNSYTLEKGFADETMNSFNHYSLGSCVESFYSHILGIKAIEEKAGFKTVILSPNFDPLRRIKGATGKYKSGMGEIEVEWHIFQDIVKYVAKVKSGIDVKFKFNNCKIQHEKVKEVNQFNEFHYELVLDKEENL